MLTRLKDTGRISETLFLLLSSLICLALSVIRFNFNKEYSFLFLNWNLFLAFIPWLFTSIIILYPTLQKNKFLFIFVVSVWLLFFPNSLYILTDLFHLRMVTTVPIWYDLMLILTFAWTGLMFGLMSLWDLLGIIDRRFNKKTALISMHLLLFIGSFGVYLGRFLRWNSWDIINQPFQLLYDIKDRFINPFEHTRTWSVTFLMYLFLLMIYWSFRIVRNRK